MQRGQRANCYKLTHNPSPSAKGEGSKVSLVQSIWTADAALHKYGTHPHTSQQPLDLSMDYKFILCQSVGHSLSLQRTGGCLSGQVSLEDAWPAPHQRQDHRHVRVDVRGHCVE